jgi:hypothetical protein
MDGQDRQDIKAEQEILIILSILFIHVQSLMGFDNVPVLLLTPLRGAGSIQKAARAAVDEFRASNIS